MKKEVKEKFKELDKKIESFEFDEEKNKKIKEDVKKEAKDITKDITNDDIGLYDDKPFIQKCVFFFVGITNFLVGFALHFLIKDDKKKKWQASYLVKGSTIGAILVILAVVLDFIFEFLLSNLN